MSDPKLKQAMAEIFGILKKHDIAGQVTLVSPTHSEFRVDLSPSWSCVALEDKQHLRFRVTKKDIPDRDERHEKAEATIHLLCQIRDLCGQNFLAFENLLKQLSQHIEFDHKPGMGFEPHESH